MNYYSKVWMLVLCSWFNSKFAFYFQDIPCVLSHPSSRHVNTNCFYLIVNTTRVPWLSRSGQDNHSGTYKKLIRARFMVETVRAVVFVVWDSSMTAATGPKPKDDGWETLKVQWWTAAAAVVTVEVMWEWSNTKRDKTAKKGQSSRFDTMLEILNKCIVLFK